MDHLTGLTECLTDILLEAVKGLGLRSELLDRIDTLSKPSDQIGNRFDSGCDECDNPRCCRVDKSTYCSESVECVRGCLTESGESLSRAVSRVTKPTKYGLSESAQLPEQIDDAVDEGPERPKRIHHVLEAVANRRQEGVVVQMGIKVSEDVVQIYAKLLDRLHLRSEGLSHGVAGSTKSLADIRDRILHLLGGFRPGLSHLG